VRLQRGVQRAAEEQLLADAIHEHDEQYEDSGAGVGRGQHTVEGGPDEQ
jgi:hypothetical protein